MPSKIKIVFNLIKRRWILDFKSRKTLEKYQRKKLEKQYKFVMENSNYFREKYKDKKSLLDFEVMNKKELMENFDNINTVDIKKEEALQLAINGEKNREFSEKCKNITVGLSSGTSGHRGLFILDDNEIEKWAGSILAKCLPKDNMLGHKIAFFLRADNNLYESINSKAIEFKYFDTYNDIEDNLKKLEQYNPTILVAPSSFLVVIAKNVERCSLKINPQKIIAVAEVLEERDKEYLKKIFGKDIIYQIYQCTEGFLGYVCECGNFHLNEDIVYLEKEYLDEKRFIPIITDFERTSEPIIRYRLNDILIEKKGKCECGSSLCMIEKIEGRDDDIFIFHSIDGGKVVIFSDFIRRIMLFTPNIMDYRIIQLNYDNVIIKISNLSKEQKRVILDEFVKLSKDKKFIMPQISFEDYEYDKSKKLKRVERCF